MNVKSIERKGNEATVVVEIDKELMESGVNKAYMKARKSIQLPGFRKGKAPRKMIEAMYGAHVFYEDGLDEIFPEIYDFAIAKQDFKAIGRPNLTDMQIGDDNIVTLTLTTEVYPEVTLGQYKGLPVTRRVRPVTEAAVASELKSLARRHAPFCATSAPAARGMRVTLDFEGFLDGAPIPDSRMEQVTVTLGTAQLMPAAEQAVYGHCAGETFRFDFTYPDEFRVPELSGKTAQFEICLHTVEQKQEPTVDDALAQRLGFATLDALRKSIRAKKAASHEANADRLAEAALLDLAGANLTVELPAAALDQNADHALQQLKDKLSRSRFSLELYCQANNTTPEQLRAGYRQDAARRMRAMLAVPAIAQAENITVSNEEVDAEYARLARLHGNPEEEIRRVLARDAVAAALTNQKVQRFLLDHAAVTSIVEKE